MMKTDAVRKSWARTIDTLWLLAGLMAGGWMIFAAFGMRVNIFPGSEKFVYSYMPSLRDSFLAGILGFVFLLRFIESASVRNLDDLANIQRNLQSRTGAINALQKPTIDEVRKP